MKLNEGAKRVCCGARGGGNVAYADRSLQLAGNIENARKYFYLLIP
jgi:hypothetical protein